MEYEVIRAEVLRAARQMLRAGLTVGDSGNVSARVAGEERLLLAITPHGRYYDTLTPEDILVVDEAGERNAFVDGEHQSLAWVRIGSHDQPIKGLGCATRYVDVPKVDRIETTRVDGCSHLTSL